jgi:hypothetical protein
MLAWRIHALEYSEVDHDFFMLWNYPYPNVLWELLDMLKWKALKGYKFTVPPQVRQFAQKLSPELRVDFQFII